MSEDEALLSHDEFILSLPIQSYNNLYWYQKDGVKWLFKRYVVQELLLRGREAPGVGGGILGDEMGLGKTFQILSFLRGLFVTSSCHLVLILCPVSVLSVWEREFEVVCGDMRRGRKPNLVTLSSDISKRRRQTILDDLLRGEEGDEIPPTIILSSYQLVAKNVNLFSCETSAWDFVILDEGHVIKNPATALNKSVHLLPTRHRLILSGTPLQNKMVELWVLMDWVTRRELLGSKAIFKHHYGDPITKGQDRLASDDERMSGEMASRELWDTLKPYILKRKKEEVLPRNLPKRRDYVVWVRLSPHQRSVYSLFLASNPTKFIIKNLDVIYPFESINHMKSICRHPLLYETFKLRKKHKAEAREYGSPLPNVSVSSLISDSENDQPNSGFSLPIMKLEERRRRMEENKTSRNREDKRISLSSSSLNMFDILRACDYEEDVSPERLVQECSKLEILLAMLTCFIRGDHNTLVFSQSRMMLDVIERCLMQRGVSWARLDGSMDQQDRRSVINSFQDGEFPILLMTTKTGGFGLTLTRADRVIVYDPSWNPADDDQAVARAYRIGQARDVEIYRLIAASGVEEKMYGKQVNICFNQSIISNFFYHVFIIRFSRMG